MSSVNTGFSKQIMPILCYNGSLVTWTVVGLTTAKFKPLIFSTSDFTLFYTADMFILMILYDFSLFPAQFCNIIVYVRKVGSCMQIADRCAPWKISSGAENPVFKVNVTLRLAVYRQSVRLGVKPLESHDQIFFFRLNSCGNSPYVASSLTRRWVCLSQICLVFRQVYISHI
jgi:hypothetical protein